MSSHSDTADSEFLVRSPKGFFDFSREFVIEKIRSPTCRDEILVELKELKRDIESLKEDLRLDRFEQTIFRGQI